MEVGAGLSALADGIGPLAISPALASWNRSRALRRPNSSPSASRRSSSGRPTRQPSSTASMTTGSRSRSAPVTVAAPAAAASSRTRRRRLPWLRPVARFARSVARMPADTADTPAAPGRPKRRIASCEIGKPAPARITTGKCERMAHRNLRRRDALPVRRMAHRHGLPSGRAWNRHHDRSSAHWCRQPVARRCITAIVLPRVCRGREPAASSDDCRRAGRPPDSQPVRSRSQAVPQTSTSPGLRHRVRGLRAHGSWPATGVPASQGCGIEPARSNAARRKVLLRISDLVLLRRVARRAWSLPRRWPGCGSRGRPRERVIVAPPGVPDPCPGLGGA